MMIRLLRLPLVTLLALAAAYTADASAHEFIVSKIGVGKMISTTTQVLTTSAGRIECKRATAALEYIVLRFEVLDVPKLEYAECSALGTRAKVSAGAYEFDANAASTVTFGKTLTIEPEALGCSFVFGAKGHSYGSVSSSSHSGKIAFALALSLPYTASGGVCGSSGTGEYAGTLEVDEEEGTIEVR
jgi:hypothetical protein